MTTPTSLPPLDRFAHACPLRITMKTLVWIVDNAPQEVLADLERSFDLHAKHYHGVKKTTFRYSPAKPE